jgi:Flp pilus assembly pilin Flp
MNEPSGAPRSSLLRGSWHHSEDGALLAEYGLLVGLIAVVCVAAIVLFGSNVLALFQSAQSI